MVFSCVKVHGVLDVNLAAHQTMFPAATLTITLGWHVQQQNAPSQCGFESREHDSWYEGSFLGKSDGNLIRLLPRPSWYFHWWRLAVPAHSHAYLAKRTRRFQPLLLEQTSSHLSSQLQRLDKSTAFEWKNNELQLSSCHFEFEILCLVFSYGFTLLFIYVSESTPWCCFESPSIHILPVLKTSVFAAVYLCDCNTLSFSANIHIVVRFKSAFTCLFYFFLTYNVERFLCFVVAVCVVISSINAAIPCAI